MKNLLFSKRLIAASLILITGIIVWSFLVIPKNEVYAKDNNFYIKLTQNNNSEEFKIIKIYKQIEIKNVKVVPASQKNAEKVIGTIVNNSDEIIQSIKITASFYDKNGNLIDVIHDWLSEIDFIFPKQPVNFSFTRTLGAYEETKEVLNPRKADSVEVKISGFSILEKEKS